MINYFDVFLEQIYNVIILTFHYFWIIFSHCGLKFVKNENEKRLWFLGNFFENFKNNKIIKSTSSKLSLNPK